MTICRAVGCYAATVGILVAVSGCSSTSDQLGSAVDDSTTAVASVQLVVDLHDDGLALDALTDTTMGDALTQLEDAQTTVTELAPAGNQREQRADVLDAIRDGITATLAAREALAAGENIDSEQLDDALRSLEQLK